MPFTTKMRVLEARDGRPRRLILGLSSSVLGGGFYATTVDEAGRRDLEVLRDRDVESAVLVDVTITEGR